MNSVLLITVVLAYGTLLLELVVLPIPSEASALSLWNRPLALRRRMLTGLAALPALLLYVAPVAASLGELLGEAALFRAMESVPAHAGVVLVWVGSVLHLTATLVFRQRAGDPGATPGDVGPVLVESGPFAVSRNPIALGLMLCALGWGLLLGPSQPWRTVALLAALYTVLYLDRKVRMEEQAVRGKFGAAYAQYATRVGRYLGRRRASTSR